MYFFMFRPHWYLKFFTVLGLLPCHASPSPPWPPRTVITASSKKRCLFLSSMEEESEEVMLLGSSLSSPQSRA